MYLLDATSKFLCLVDFQHHHLAELGEHWYSNVKDPAIGIMEGVQFT